MKAAAIVCWVFSVLAVGFLAMFTVGSISTTGPDGATQADVVGFFDGMTAIGALVYGSTFAFFVAGCVFWAAHQLSRRLDR